MTQVEVGTPIRTAPSPHSLNIASYLSHVAGEQPDRPAVIVSKKGVARDRAVQDALTFAELEALSNRYANGLSSAGFARGMRVLLMVRPGVDFQAVSFALFKIGAVPVMIDPGMGVGKMLECIRTVDLQAFIGVPLAHVMRVLRRRAFKDVRHIVTVGSRWFWGGPTLHALAKGADDRFTQAQTRSEDAAAILFTSGSTGPAKGVVYEHGMFDAQIKAIQSQYGLEPGEIDMPTFPLFALFSTAMGLTVVIPDMNPSHPGRADPARIVEAITDHAATTTFGSPALWGRVADYCVEYGVKLPSLRRILIAGAPVPYRLIEKLLEVLDPRSDVHSPYGATESLPVCSMSGREVVGGCSERIRRGAGTCVGKPLPGIDLGIIRITDQPIAEWSDDLLVPEGQIGEITVSGPVVTREYFGLEQATTLAKIRDGDRVWHRIGDVGYFDADGRLWFCGRKAHRVETEHGTLFSMQCEAIFNEHPDVFRSALVGVGAAGHQRPAIIVEPHPGRFPRGRARTRLRGELLDLARASELTARIKDFLFRRALPVDIRHNAKIDREALANWAACRQN